MNRPLTKRLHRDYITVYRLSSFITHVIGFVIVMGILILSESKGWSVVPGWIGVAVVTISTILFVWLVPEWKYRNFHYELFEEELEIQSGFIVIKNVLVPMVRVQHVELESGPFMRKYELASVEVVTAATTHRISGLKRSEAERLKRQIGLLAKVDDKDE